MNLIVFVTFSILLQLMIISPAAVADDEDTPGGQCDIGNGGDVATAVDIKKSLIQDLIAKVPSQPGQSYCNVLTSDGLEMFGFGECTTRGWDDAAAKCNDCLNSVGDYLIMYCTDTGAGHAWDKLGFCYFRVGFSRDAVCSSENA